jgi:hypothetical protein
MSADKVTDEVYNSCKTKDKVKVDLASITEHIKTNGLRCCYKREKGSFLNLNVLLSLAARCFSIKRKLCGKWNNAYLHADAHLLL